MAEIPMTREERNADIVARWRACEPWRDIAASHSMSVAATLRVVQVLIDDAEIMDRRATLASKAQQRFTDEDLLEMVKACALDLDRTPGHAAFDTWCGHFWAQLVQMRFGSWAEGCSRAGLVPHPQPPGMGNPTYSVEDHLRAYRRIKGLVDRVTVAAWHKHALLDEPKEGTLRRRYGNWREFVRAMEQAE